VGYIIAGVNDCIINFEYFGREVSHDVQISGFGNSATETIRWFQVCFTFLFRDDRRRCRGNLDIRRLKTWFPADFPLNDSIDRMGCRIETALQWDVMWQWEEAQLCLLVYYPSN